jgi:hypothetical protein
MSPNIKNHFMVVRRGHSRSIAHHQSAWLVPIRITSDVGTTLAAGRANILDIIKPKVIRPAISVDRDIVAATVVQAMTRRPRTPWERSSAKVIFWGVEWSFHFNRALSNSSASDLRSSHRSVFFFTSMTSHIMEYLFDRPVRQI